MKINFSNSSLKFLEKINEKDKERIRLKIKEMILEIETTGIIPFAKLNIKNLKETGKDFSGWDQGKFESYSILIE